jgi:hypothetical protein
MKHKIGTGAFGWVITIAASALLAACSGTAPTSEAAGTQANTISTPGQQVAASGAAQADLTRSDTQGMVEVAVSPVNLLNPGETLVFEISMNTHSVDLSMDLATLATLSTDTGKTAEALKWDAPSGGHHVSGKLSFPAKVNGNALLDGAKRLTLTINNVDAPERVFVWELGS